MKEFKRVVMGLLVFPLMWAVLSADINLHESEKGKFSVYGFIKLDSVYQDAGVNLLGAARYAVPGDGNLFMTAQNSRFGFKLNPAALGNGLKIAGTLEWDLFDPATPNQMKFRTRQAFLTLQKGQSSFILGQTWDVFSPLGPSTLNTNGFLWQVGNLGFRHAQIRYMINGKTVDFAVSANDPASVSGWKAMLPVMQARIGLKLSEKGQIQLGLSGVYGQEKLENTTVVPVYGNTVEIIGLSLDWLVPFGGGWTLKGEYAFGENLAYFLSRSSVWHQIDQKKYEGKQVNTFWSQMTYTVKSFSAWGGYSFENLSGKDQLAATELKKTSCIMLGAQYSLGGGVAIGAELSHFYSLLANNLSNQTNQFCLSAIYSF